MFGRHGESPVPIVAARTPGDCFYAAIEAARIALKYRTPVILLSDGYLANGAEPWRLPDVADAARHLRRVRHRAQPHRRRRHRRVLALPPRPRDAGPARGPSPGTPGLMHRIGGLEKADGTGNVSYDPANHEQMVQLRAAKVAGIAKDIPLVEVDDPDGRRRRRPGARLGLDLRRHRRRHPDRCGPGATGSPRPTCATSTRSRQPRRGAAAVPQGARPGDEPRPAGQAGPGRVPRRRPGRQQGAGHALQGGRDRRGHPRPAAGA